MLQSRPTWSTGGAATAAGLSKFTQKFIQTPKLWAAWAALCLAGTTAAWAGHAHYGFDTDPTGTLLDIVGTGHWVATGGNPGGYLVITDALGGQKTTIFFDDFDNGLIVSAFTFTCDLKLGDGTSSPADGFSINFVRTNDPALLSHDGNNFAAAPTGEGNLPEEGTQTGISIGFDTWQSGPTAMSAGLPDGDVNYDTIGIDIRVDNKLIYQFPMRTLNGAPTDPTSIQTGPRLNGDGTNPALTWQPLIVQLKQDGTLNITWKNVLIVSNLQTSYNPGPGRLLFSGRTGGAWELNAVDNIDVTTFPASGPVISGVVGTPSYVDFQLQDQSGITVNTNQPILITLDGAALPPTSLSYANNKTTLHLVYGANTYLTMNSKHAYSVIFTDSNGSVNTNANKSFTVTGYPFEAVNTKNFMVEGTDFNFGGGQFIDNVTLSSTAGPNNYLDKVGTANVDENDPAENGANHAYRSYDATSGTGEVVGTEPVGTTEAALRSAPGGKYDPAITGDASIVPYDVGWVDVGEWYNYTRTIPAGKYKVYSRLANGTGGNFLAQLDAVLSNPAVANQTTAPVGQIPGIPTGGWQNYQYFPLVDPYGSEVVLPLGGKTTWRFTTLSGGLNVEFFSFVPITTAGTLLPYLSTVSPLPGATAVSPGVTISANIVNRDTSVDTSKIVMSVNGTAVTPVITPNAIGASVSYPAPSLYPLGVTNNVQLVYSDKASTPNKVTNQWSFVVISQSQVPFTMPTAYALPANSGQTPGFYIRNIQIDQGAPQANGTSWSESILSGRYGELVESSDSPQVINYRGVGGGANFGNDADFNSSFNLAGGNNFALETVFYLALQPGVYTLGVNSDDGFRVTTGQYPHQLVTMPGAEYDGGRGPGNSFWKFLVLTNGLYPFRLTYEEGGGGYEVEFFSRDDSGKLHLINDPTDSSSIKAYHFSTAMPAGAIKITQAPTDQTVVAGGTATFSAAATTTVDNPFFLLYDWSVGGNHVGFGPSLLLQNVQAGDAGTYTCTITYLGYQQSTMTTSAKLTVTARTTPPVIQSIVGSSSLSNIVITFDEVLDGVSAATAGNYAVDGGLTVSAATLSADGMHVTLNTSGQTAGKVYNVTLNGIKDQAGNVIPANTKVAMAADVIVNGYIESDHFEFGGSGGGQNSVDLLTGDPTYPNSPTVINYLSRFDSYADGRGDGPDNDGRRVWGWFIPDQTTGYNFFLRSDDASQLWISTDNTFANLQKVAEETGCCNAFKEPGAAQTTATPLNLVAGQQYAIMALQKNGVGGDYVQVAFRKVGDSTAAGNLSPIPGSFLASYAPADGMILQQVPAPGTTVGLPNLIRVVHLDAAVTFTATNVTLLVDGVAVTPTVTKSGAASTVSYVPSTPFAAHSTHTAALVYANAGGTLFTNQWSFTVGATVSDRVHGYVGVLMGPATLTPDAGGHTGQAGDTALDLGNKVGPGTVYVSDATFLNAAAANDTMSVSLWIKKYDIANSSAFWVDSPSTGRAFQAHVPWSDDTVYFDTAGCCGGSTQRINASIKSFSGYTAVGNDSWWASWHHFVFTKQASIKQIWIDGQLFLQGTNTAALPTDITDLYIGSQSATGSNMHGQIDDFAIFSTGLSQASVQALFGGAPPISLASEKLVAFWDFNVGGGSSLPPPGPKLAAAKSGSNIVISWTTTAGFNLMSASSLTKPITWSAVSQTPTVNGTTSSVTVPIGTGNQFFQLAK